MGITVRRIDSGILRFSLWSRKFICSDGSNVVWRNQDRRLIDEQSHHAGNDVTRFLRALHVVLLSGLADHVVDADLFRREKRCYFQGTVGRQIQRSICGARQLPVGHCPLGPHPWLSVGLFCSVYGNYYGRRRRLCSARTVVRNIAPHIVLIIALVDIRSV